MTFQLDKEWDLQPIKGATHQTYMGIREKDRVFIKRNTSPLLAALSKEGIAPKLVWTKRTVAGDILTAQEWLEGSQLEVSEIGSRNDVIDVLYHLHHSRLLKKMLNKIGGQVKTPEMLLEAYRKQLPTDLEKNTFLTKIHRYLGEHLPDYLIQNYTVVHGDVHHRNWLVSNNYLYLVDWDSVVVADPAVDIGMFLGHYVPCQRWEKWLLAYGIYPHEQEMARIKWYIYYGFLKEIIRNYTINNKVEMNAEIMRLKRAFDF